MHFYNSTCSRPLSFLRPSPPRLLPASSAVSQGGSVARGKTYASFHCTNPNAAWRNNCSSGRGFAGALSLTGSRQPRHTPSQSSPLSVSASPPVPLSNLWTRLYQTRARFPSTPPHPHASWAAHKIRSVFFFFFYFVFFFTPPRPSQSMLSSSLSGHHIWSALFINIDSAPRWQSFLAQRAHEQLQNNNNNIKKTGWHRRLLSHYCPDIIIKKYIEWNCEFCIATSRTYVIFKKIMS